MTISLTPALDALVARKLATGLYESPGEVVREALRQMVARESSLEWLRQEAAVGFEQLDRGEFVEMDHEAFMSRFRNRRQAA
ncbi:MAG TPA: type II toxin-antitoxin system ParD family antitoxin [Verrucomicrobiales bacterium]|nr:type II toxin-antitoxin system ParD family antitoxin [Verrucomicrobiales bacterium]